MTSAIYGKEGGLSGAKDCRQRAGLSFSGRGA